jgi:hypothetical protein
MGREGNETKRGAPVHRQMRMDAAYHCKLVSHCPWMGPLVLIAVKRRFHVVKRRSSSSAAATEEEGVAADRLFYTL